jgi:hypothetical protein
MISKKKICEECKKESYIWSSKTGRKLCKQCSSNTGVAKLSIKPTAKAKPIPARSQKRSKEERLYSAKRIIYLAKNTMCAMHIPGICIHKATTVQHLRGRIGDLLLDESEWMPACWPCHSYADTHPAEAFEKGWAKQRIN